MNDRTFICDCHSTEHQIRVMADEEDLYIQVHLTTHENFFNRLWSGVKYIFGHKSRFGDWDEFILNRDDKNSLALHLFSEEDRYTIHNALGTQATFLSSRAKYVRDMNGHEHDKLEAFNVRRIKNVFLNSNQDFWNEHEMTTTEPYGKFLF